MHPSSFSSRWGDWVPDCLHHAIANASELPYHQDQPQGDDRYEAVQHYADDEEAGVHPGRSQEEEEEEEDEDEDDDQDLHLGHRQQENDDHGIDNNGLDDEDDAFSQAPLDAEEGEIDYEEEAEEGEERGEIRLTIVGPQHYALGRPEQLTNVCDAVCLSCKSTYHTFSAGTCPECFEEASETEKALRKEIEELNARVAFLKSWSLEAMSEKFTDIVLETPDGFQIRAHRGVLVSRSSVFKAMLDSEMEESRSRIIKITDFSYEILRLFVHYLYTAELYPESLEECCYDLLVLAEKYNVKHLKSLCEHFMISKVHSENALFSYEYACQHGAKALKEVALSIILENIHELTAKDQYRELVNRDAKLVVEIFEAYLTKKTK